MHLCNRRSGFRCNVVHSASSCSSLRLSPRLSFGEGSSVRFPSRSSQRGLHNTLVPTYQQGACVCMSNVNLTRLWYIFPPDDQELRPAQFSNKVRSYVSPLPESDKL